MTTDAVDETASTRFIEWIRHLRETQTQAQVAKMTGLSPSYVGKLSRGETSNVRRNTIVGILTALDIDPAVIEDGTPIPEWQSSRMGVTFSAPAPWRTGGMLALFGGGLSELAEEILRDDISTKEAVEHGNRLARIIMSDPVVVQADALMDDIDAGRDDRAHGIAFALAKMIQARLKP